MKQKIEEEAPWTEEQIKDINKLNESIKKGSSDFILMLREIADQQGGITKLSKKSGIPRVSLYTMLSGKNKTTTKPIFNIMAALGYGFKIVEKKKNGQD